jgi:hypothetical protein
MLKYADQFSLRLLSKLPLWAMHVVLGLIAVVSLQATYPASAQAPVFRSPETAPPAWARFSVLVKGRFEQWLAADEAVANRFRDWLAQAAEQRNSPPPTLVVRAWLDPDGGVARVAFESLGNDRADEDLRRILTSGKIGALPPPDMLQPIRFRLSLKQAD